MQSTAFFGSFSKNNFKYSSDFYDDANSKKTSISKVTLLLNETSLDGNITKKIKLRYF